MNRTLAAAALSVTLAACAGSRAESAPAPQPAPSAASAQAQASRTGMMCPMDIPGTTVTPSDTADGEALTFTTTSGQVDELRSRVRALADMHNQHMASEGTGTGHDAAEGTGSGATAEPPHAHHRMPASRATVDDVENGARVSVVPLDPAQADQLRATARMHAMHMQQHGCGMMHGG